MYLAANISNPFVAPWLVFLEIQAGAWLRRGAFHPLTVERGQDDEPGDVRRRPAGRQRAWARCWRGLAGVDDLCCSCAGTAIASTSRELVRLASDRYIDGGLMAWEFARGKLRGDPIYRACVCGGLLLTPVRTAAMIQPAPARAEPCSISAAGRA